MNRLDKLINEAEEITEARIVKWGDIYMPLLTQGSFSRDDLDKVRKNLFAGDYNDDTAVVTTDFLRTVERIFGTVSKQFVAAVHHCKSKGWEGALPEGEIPSVDAILRFAKSPWPQPVDKKITQSLINSLLDGVDGNYYKFASNVRKMNVKVVDKREVPGVSPGYLDYIVKAIKDYAYSMGWTRK